MGKRALLRFALERRLGHWTVNLTTPNGKLLSLPSFSQGELEVMLRFSIKDIHTAMSRSQKGRRWVIKVWFLPADTLSLRMVRTFYLRIDVLATDSFIAAMVLNCM